jgi:hypothetical protein
MGINLRMPPNKDFNSIILKIKRKELNNKKLPSKGYANFVNKFWETKYKKFKLAKD